MLKINEKQNPDDSLKEVLNIKEKICNCVEESLENSSKKSQVTIEPDDLMNIMVFVIIQSQ